MYLEPFHHSIDSQTAFAKLSGDFNPIHLDPIFARRTIFGKVVTHCPHCLNTLKNEYTQFGGDYEVIHHTELLSKLVSEGKLEPNPSLSLHLFK